MSDIPVLIDGASCTLQAGETLLDAALRQGLRIPFSCRGGSCGSCLLRSVEGEPPAAAQRGLSPELQARGYLLACLCRPDAPLSLSRPDPRDLATACRLLQVEARGDYLLLRFETARRLPLQPGQRLLLAADNDSPEPELQVSEVEFSTRFVEALIRADADLPPWLIGAQAGQAFAVLGPLDAPAAESETAPPPTDPALWQELDAGRMVRVVLADFYARLYQDPQLAPFFEGVTRERAIDKQYSFLQQLMSGERVYFGDRPRNAHHWMVISDALFDHRQALIAAGTRVRYHLRLGKLACPACSGVSGATR